MLSRRLNQLILNTKKSVLLLGPRQTGKSTLIRQTLPDLSINFADEETYLQFVASAGELRNRLGGSMLTNGGVVFIDEIQRIPSVLNTVQALVDEHKNLKFYLTGSSARKLRRGHANLLPGRIHTYQLGPIVTGEVNYALDTEKVLQIGTLPGILTDEDSASARKTLRSYAATYLKEEIQAEALTRNVEGFARFLNVVTSWSGSLVDYTKIASLAMVSRQSVTRYFDILQDTLIFQRLGPFTKSSKLKLIQHPKAYIFDVGVLNGLLDNFTISDDRVGLLFETLILSQIQASLYSLDKESRISFYLTEGGAEVDFIVEHSGTVFCIEVKSATHITSLDTRGFESFKRFYGKPHKRIVLYRGTLKKEIDEVMVLPWQEGLREMGL